MKKYVLPVLFCLLLAAGTVLGLAMPDHYWSDHERRTLKQFPALTAKRLFSGKFAEELETYLADQFPGRDGWVTAKTLAERLSGKPESGGVSLGADGYLIGLHPSLDEEQLAANLAALKALSDKLSETGVTLTVMPVPTAAWTLRDKLPAHSPNADQSAVAAAAEAEGLRVFDPGPALAAHADEYIYYRTDHHWNLRGAWMAYKACCRADGLQACSLEDFSISRFGNFYGTTRSRSGLPALQGDTLECAEPPGKIRMILEDGQAYDRLIFPEQAETYDGYAVYLNGNHGMLEIVNPDAPEGTLLVYKDSFANCLLPLLSASYRRIVAVDARYYAGSFSEAAAAAGKVNKVLFVYSPDSLVNDTAVAGKAGR